MSKLFLLIIFLGCIAQDSFASKSDSTKTTNSESIFVIVDKRAHKDLSYPVSSDRPSASYSSHVLPRGRMIFETGGVFTVNDSDPLRTTHININNSLVRYGALNNFEVRLGWNYDYFKYTFKPLSADSLALESDEIGLSPVFIGGKVRLFSQSNFFKNSAIVAHINLKQLASPTLRTTYNAHNIYFISDIPSSGKFGMTYNVGLSWNGFSAQANGAASTCFTYGIGNLTAFAELYTTWSNKDDFHLSTDAGVQWILGNRIQLDASAGIGVYNNPAWFVSGGLTCLIF